jgi:hypothetical protein
LDSYFASGYYIGAVLFIAVVGLVFWFVGRWGWVGLIIRIGCALLILLKLIQVIEGR